MIFSQRQALPLCQRMHYLGTGIAQVLDGERHSTLHAIQVVVNTQALQYKQRSRHTTKSQLRREVLLKELLNQFNALLRLLHVQQRLVSFWFYQLTHL